MTNPAILLVEDEQLLRMSFALNLKRKGYVAKTTESGEQALTHLQQQSVDVLITDYLMLGMTGTELMVQAKILQPEIKVIVMSGFGESDVKKHIMNFGADSFLFKPITIDQLIKQISLVWSCNCYHKVYRKHLNSATKLTYNCFIDL